ncbi:MAG: 50S ribosomal protein L6 [Acidobacteria bacterium]|nr:50S ribosomal protein L6 [Acidobacteriota bacterium]
MSRVGRKPIKIPAGVKVSIHNGRVLVEGPKGKLEHPLPPGISAEVEDENLVTKRQSDEKNERALHGLTRSLLANAIHGVTQGFQKELDIVGIGYKAELKGKYLNLSLGYSHPIEFPVPQGITIKVERVARVIQNYAATVVITGIDKYRVGQIAADIRSLRTPDSYKGKGIRYSNEVIKLKEGKKGA